MTTIIDRKPRITCDDIVAMYRDRGITPVSVCVATLVNPVKSLDKVISIIREDDSNRDISDLMKLRDLLDRRKVKIKRGAKSLSELGVKIYKTQKSNGNLFIVLPLSPFEGLEKHSKVSVWYDAESEQVIVQKVN